MLFTAERTNEKSISDNPIYQRHVFAYQNVLPYITGNALEVGCGEGYGSKMLKPSAKNYTAVDKFKALNSENLEGINFKQMNVPPLTGLTTDTYDVVVSFQVIEHIEDDDLFVKEISRVLKPGSKFVVTTPNIKMSLTRNPYHVREYTWQQLNDLLKKHFSAVDMKGIFGDKTAMDYFEKNKESVKRFTRFDVLNLQYNLPRSILRIPYDIANRMNRLRLQKENTGLVNQITTDNFYLDKAADLCFDLFAVCTK
ncbi:MAG: class I SAM-dependent methyltransferase [Bacteroidia bacterium]|nr:class I SAM-dependent methyltransferase [Bacteroidia bacterium]